MIEIDLAFPHSYEIKEISELPGAGKFNLPVFYFPRTKARPEHDGIWLNVNSVSGRSWIGVFDFGDQSPPAISKVVSTPDPGRCVISKGAAYCVNVDKPEVWETLDFMPVLDVRSIPAHEIIVFADFIRLVAYGRNGIIWKSPRLCWDDLKIQSVTEDRIDGVGYDPINSESTMSQFAVDLRTGQSLYPSRFPLTEDPSGRFGRTYNRRFRFWSIAEIFFRR